MPQISLPNALDQNDWLKKVTPALDKPTKIGASLGAINGAFDKVPVKLLDFSALKDTEEANKRVKEIEDKVAKPLLAIVASLKKLESDVKGAQNALKGKEAAVKGLLAAMASFASDAKSVPDAALTELGTLIKTLEAKDKKEQAKGQEADPGAAKDAVALKKKVLAHNAKVKKYIRDLRSGKFPSFPFAFAQNKKKVPYKKGQDWEDKSLAHVGPKALKSFKSQFPGLMGTDAFLFCCGEVRYSLTGKDAKKLIFLFETPLANPKQLKDALLFQCGYAPALQLRKDTGEVIDEAGEGEDSGEDLGDVEDDDEAPGLVLSSAQKKTFEDAMALAGEPGKLIKRKFDEAQELAKSATGAARAKTLITEAETAAKALLAKAGEAAKAQPGGVSAELVERIRKASQGWAASSAQAEKGIDQVMLALNKMFTGDDRQAPKVKDALRTLNNLKPKLKSDLGAKLEQASKELNESRRANLIKEAAAAAAAVEKRIADDPLMGELDGTNNDVLPGVNIIGPMKAAIGAIRALA